MRSRFLDRTWFLAFAIASSAWCWTASRAMGPTFDEPLYVRAGLAFWETGSHGELLREGTMPLAADVQTLAVRLAELFPGARLDRDTDFEEMLAIARTANLVFWWLLLAGAWKAGRELAGPWGARLAVALIAAEPVLLGHASLATTDLPLAASLMWLGLTFRAGRDAGPARRILVPGLWFGISLLAKASALVLAPAVLLAVELERFFAGRGTPAMGQRLGEFGRDLARVAGVGLGLTFLYCGSDWRAQPTLVQWARSLPDGPPAAAIVWTAEHLRIFPNAGEALVRQFRHNVRGEGTFVLGRARPPVWYYFPLAAAIKASLTLLALPLIAAVARPRSLATWPAFTAAALLVVSVFSRVQIGIRFFLPLLVFASLAAAVAAPRSTQPVLAAAAAVGVALSVVSAVGVWPHGICYANALWGGTAKGSLLLSDSNCDWGQGLPDLQRWHERAGRPPLALWYFGTDPAVSRSGFELLPFHVLAVEGPADVIRDVRGRHLAASLTLLYGVPLSDSHRRTAEFLRTIAPAGRTATLFVYDFTREPVTFGPWKRRPTARESAPLPTSAGGCRLPSLANASSHAPRG